MERRHKGIQNILISAICLVLLVLPAVHQFRDLVDWEILSPIPSYEIARSQEMALGWEGSVQGLELNGFTLMLLLPANFFKQAFHDSFPAFSINPQAPILRC